MTQNGADTKALHGLVIRQIEYKESSRIVDILTLEQGKKSFIAQGARRNKSKSQNLTELFVSATFNLTGRGNLLYLKDGQIDDAHFGLRKTIDKLAGASYVTELASMSTVEEEPYPEVYFLLKSAWKALEAANDRIAVIRILSAYTLKLMSFLGFRPQLGRCIACGKPVAEVVKPNADADTRSVTGSDGNAGVEGHPEHVYFDVVEGGVFCESCAESGRQAKRLSKEAYAEITGYIRKGLNELAPMTAGVDPVEIHRMLRQFFVAQTGLEKSQTAKTLFRLGLL